MLGNAISLLQISSRAAIRPFLLGDILEFCGAPSAGSIAGLATLRN
jgi:hypothetical protein